MLAAALAGGGSGELTEGQTKFAAQRKAHAAIALLRLGQSMAALKEKEAACAAFGEILRKYPRASAGVKAAVGREQKRVQC